MANVTLLTLSVKVHQFEKTDTTKQFVFPIDFFIRQPFAGFEYFSGRIFLFDIHKSQGFSLHGTQNFMEYHLQDSFFATEE